MRNLFEPLSRDERQKEGVIKWIKSGCKACLEYPTGVGKTELVKSNIEALIDICEETPAMLDEATHEFNKLTSIFNKKDIPFFVFSVLLQGAMKYFIKYLRELKEKRLIDSRSLQYRTKSLKKRYFDFAKKHLKELNFDIELINNKDTEIKNVRIL